MNYISQIFTPVESLGMEIQTIQSAIAGVRRINDFLSSAGAARTSPASHAQQLRQAGDSLCGASRT